MNQKKIRMGERFSRRGHLLKLVVEAETLEKQRKKGNATLVQPAGKTFTIYCDEGSYLEGEDTAPPPLSYFSAAVAFCLLSHVSLYATMLRLKIKKTRVRVRSEFFGAGSVLAETIETNCQGVETVLEIESEEDPAKISKLARLAEAGCYVIQSLKAPVNVNYQVQLNGRRLQIRTESEGLGSAESV